MNIIKKHYAIKQCKEFDELISIQEDICVTLELGYDLCADFANIIFYAKIYLKNDKHIQDAGYLADNYRGDKLEAVREIRIGWDCYKNDHKDDEEKIVYGEDDYRSTWENIDDDFKLFWKDYEVYKNRANRIISTFENRELDFANLHCIQDLMLEYDFYFNCKALSTKLTEHLRMIRTFKFAQAVISEGHWIKKQWSKSSWTLSEKEKVNLGIMNDIDMTDSTDKIAKDVEKAKAEAYSIKCVDLYNVDKKVNVKCYRDNGDGTMDWVDCPVIVTDSDNNVVGTLGSDNVNNNGTEE